MKVVEVASRSLRCLIYTNHAVYIETAMQHVQMDVDHVWMGRDFGLLFEFVRFHRDACERCINKYLISRIRAI